MINQAFIGVRSHFDTICPIIGQLSSDNSYSDISIVCKNGDVITANKLVLVQSSKLLRKIFFESGSVYPTFETVTFNLICPDFDGKALRHVFDLVFTGKTNMRLV
jgi:hypothetical protein